MRKSYLLAAMAAITLGIGVANFSAEAQHTAPRGAAAAGPVVLLDVKYIFEKHPRHKAMMDGMKADVSRAEAEIKSQKQTIDKLRGQLKDWKVGSAEYKSLETDILRRTSDLQIKMQMQRKEFLQQEAKIYYTIYQEIQQEVNYYATANGISMVLQFNGEPIDGDKPETILQGINRPVVWYSKPLDITPVILQRLSPTRPATGGPDRMGGRPAPVPFK